MTRLLLLAVLAVAACSPPPDAPTPESPPDGDAPFASEADYRQQRAQAVEALEAVLQTEAGSVGTCRVVATSEQACGGPTSFAVYSADASDGADVERLAARIVALDERANGEFEYVSTCMAYEAPTPVLRDGRCVAER